ncbi:nuclear transport factor 2 family protein [Streptomyces huiliensis]|uniref:nuclear transport factor 2 family protein n=1 Tax=Streptomyces huiliensis TaxID=2876027 RepID=UPI001CBB0263|nr:nuclear transport factor 2 family protein [Streptomyces huiliensis]MBZ4324221.1 nuclear transport factor 2 family protein [Streptomyces huiliensis]
MAPEDTTGGLCVRESDTDLHRAGLTRDPEPWEDGLRETPRPGTFEWWYFDAECDDGSRAVVVFETKALDAAAGPLAPRLSLTVRTPDGHVHAGRTRHDPASFRAARDHCDVAIGPHRAHGDLTRYRIRARTPSAAADLTLTAVAPPSRVGTGTVALADDPGRYLGWLVAVPRGTVEGRLSVPGRTWRVRGTGYHDKNWGTLDFGAVLREWHWTRLHAGPFTLACAELRTRRGGRTPLLVLTRGPERLAATAAGVSLTPRPDRTEIHWHDRLRALLGPPTPLEPPQKPAPHPYHRFTAPAELAVTTPHDHTTTAGMALAEHATFPDPADRTAPARPRRRASSAPAGRASTPSSQGPPFGDGAAAEQAGFRTLADRTPADRTAAESANRWPPAGARTGVQRPASPAPAGRVPSAPPERHTAGPCPGPPTAPTPAGRTPGTHPEAPATDARTVAARLVRAWSLPDSAAFGALFVPDAAYTDVAAGHTHRGRAAITDWHRDTRAAIPDLRAEVEDVFGTDGGRACAILLWTGTPVADTPGPPFRVRAATVLTLAPDGSITHCADYYDRLGPAREGHSLVPRRAPETGG